VQLFKALTDMSGGPTAFISDRSRSVSGNPEVSVRVDAFFWFAIAEADFQVIVEHFISVAVNFDEARSLGGLPRFLLGGQDTGQSFLVLKYRIRHIMPSALNPVEIADGL
jgi:hypothetical protein